MSQTLPYKYFTKEETSGEMKQCYVGHCPVSECIRPLDDILGRAYKLLPKRVVH